MSDSRSTTRNSTSPWAIAVASFLVGGLVIAGGLFFFRGGDTVTDTTTTTQAAATTQPTSTQPEEAGPSYGEEPPAVWDVVAAEEGSVVELVAEPASTEVVVALPFDSRDLESTGRIALADGVLWREIVTPDGPTGWVAASVLGESGEDAPETDAGIPEAAAEMVDEIRSAVEAEDLDTLAGLALDGAFTASFGSEIATVEELVALWEEIGRAEVLESIRGLISLPDWYETEARDSDGEVVAIYVTPRFMHEPSNPENRRALEEALGSDYVESSVADGQYLGWRLGVTADGDWQFFVAGD